MNRFVDSKRRHVDIDRLRDIGGQTLDVDGAHQRLQDSAFRRALGLAMKPQWHGDLELGGQIDLVQIGVQELAGNRRALHGLDDDVAAVEVGPRRVKLD